MSARKVVLVVGFLLSPVSGWAAALDENGAGDGAPVLVTTDTTPPIVTAPIQRLTKGKVGTTVPINLRWSATDAGGSVSYKLWRSTNGGIFVRDKTLSPTATSHTYRLTVGNSYRFLVRAYDSAGNASAPAHGRTFTPNIIDDRSCCFYFARGGNWKQELKSGAYGGSVTTLYAAAPGTGGHVRFRFTGRDVALVWYVDGGPRIVNSWHWATLDTRTIELRASGSGHTSVDAFVVNE